MLSSTFIRKYNIQGHLLIVFVYATKNTALTRRVLYQTTCKVDEGMRYGWGIFLECVFKRKFRHYYHLLCKIFLCVIFFNQWALYCLLCVVNCVQFTICNLLCVIWFVYLPLYNWLLYNLRSTVNFM